MSTIRLNDYLLLTIDCLSYLASELGVDSLSVAASMTPAEADVFFPGIRVQQVTPTEMEESRHENSTRHKEHVRIVKEAGIPPAGVAMCVSAIELICEN